MSFKSIKIYRDIPVIDGFAQIPDNLEAEKESYEAPRSGIAVGGAFDNTELSLGSGDQTGSKFGAQRFIRLDPIQPDQWYDDDPLMNLTNPTRSMV
jgi:hypothetical protein